MFVNWVNYFHFNHIPFNIVIMVWDTVAMSIKTNPYEFAFLYGNITNFLLRFLAHDIITFIANACNNKIFVRNIIQKMEKKW